jgi:hypothetical protein
VLLATTPTPCLGHDTDVLGRKTQSVPVLEIPARISTLLAPLSLKRTLRLVPGEGRPPVAAGTPLMKWWPKP